MPCQYFKTFMQDCYQRLGMYFYKTAQYCNGKNYEKCPLYIIKENDVFHCEYLKTCPDGGHYQYQTFDQFIKDANLFCLSEDNHKNCQRYQTRQKGMTPLPTQLPQGEIEIRQNV